MSDCIFCKIATGKVPAKIYYEDDEKLAFQDTRPVAPVHVLLIPRKHIPDLMALAEEDAGLAGRLQLLAGQLATELGVAETGFRLVNNCREEGGQIVYHLHYHLVGGRQMRGLG